MIALLTAAGAAAGRVPCACGPSGDASCSAAVRTVIAGADCCGGGQAAWRHAGGCSCGCALQSAQEDQQSARFAPPAPLALPAPGPSLSPAPAAAGSVRPDSFVAAPLSGRSPPSLRAPPLES